MLKKIDHIITILNMSNCCVKEFIAEHLQNFDIILCQENEDTTLPVFPSSTRMGYGRCLLKNKIALFTF